MSNERAIPATGLYLVIAHHEMDDLPLKLFEKREDAVEFAKTVDPMGSERVRTVFGTDCSTPCCVSVVKIAHDGIPIRRDIVVDCDKTADVEIV